MALSALVVWEVRTSGNDGNGGGFHTGATGTDFSVQDAAQATLSAASVVHSTTTQINVAPGDFTVSAADVGNLLNITSGTATLGVYEITVVDVPNNRWTVDRSVGSVGQTTIGAMGGAMATPGRACQFSVSTNIIYIKAGTYTMTTGSSNVSNGVLNKTNTFVEGYETTRGDLGTPPLLQADGVITVFTLANLASCDVVNINFDANNRATARCLIVSNGFAYKCKFSNATNEGIQLGAAGLAIFCEATGCSAQSAFRLFSAGAACYFCYAHDNTVNGFSIPTGGMCVNCIAETNTGSTDGFVLNGPGSCINCTAYNNGREGIRIASNGVMIVNCIAEGNGTVGIRNSSNTSAMYLINNAGVNNGTSNVDMGTGKFNANIGFVTGSASFFTDAANGDFSLNNSAGGGALARNAGIPGVFPNGTTTGFEDIGAVQHEDSGGGGGGSSAVLRGVNMIPYKTNYY